MTLYNCPHCGEPLSIPEPSARSPKRAVDTLASLVFWCVIAIVIASCAGFVLPFVLPYVFPNAGGVILVEPAKKAEGR